MSALHRFITGLLVAGLLVPAGARAQDNANWWEGFHPPGVMKGSYKGKVHVIVSRDEQVYIGGSFDRVGLVDAANIARWDGARWHALGAGVNGEVTEIHAAELALFVAGNFTTAGGEAARYVARWEGGDWYPVGSGDFDGRVYAFESHNGQLYAGGSFTPNGAAQMWHLARLVGDEWEQAESTGPVCYVCYPSQIRALKSYDGRLWVGGTFDTIDGVHMYNIAVWDEEDGYQRVGSGGGAQGGIDPMVTCFEDQAASIYFGGQFLYADWEDCLGLGYAAGGEALYGIAPYGAADYWVRDLVDLGETTLVVTDKWLRTRGGGAWGAALGSLVGAYCGHQAGSSIYAGGELIAVGTHVDGLARWDGHEWLRVGAGLAWRNDYGDQPRTITSWDGDLFIGGTQTGVRSVSYDEPNCPGTLRYDGQSLHPLAPGLDPTSCSLVYQGELVVGGEFNPGGDGHLSRIARRVGDEWLPLGGGVSQSPSSGAVNALTEWNGHLILGGYFSQADALACDNLVAWDGADYSLVDAADFGGDVLALCVFAGDLIVGGKFSTLDGAAVGRIARWDGATWTSMNSGFDGWVDCLTVWEGRLIAGGHFSAANGVAVQGIASWDGAAWQPLGAGVDAHVLALQASNAGLFAGGDFTLAGGEPASAVARWDGGAWTSLGDGLTGGPLQPTVRDFTLHDGHLYMVGSFLYAGGKLSANLARWAEEMTAVALLDFHAHALPGGVDLDWAVAADGPPRLRLEAGLGDQRWEPAFTELPGGRYRCADRAPQLAGGGSVAYRLWGRDGDEDWTLLRRIEVLVAPLPAALRPRLAVWPNPANPAFQVELTLPAAMPVELAVLDVGGRRVALLHAAALAAGAHRFTWDGRDTAGRPLASGVYLLSLHSPAGAQSQRLVLLR